MGRQTIIVDFDGVLNSYASGWQGAAVIPDPPVAHALEWLQEMVGTFDVAVVSTRSHQPGGREAMKAWILEHGKTFTRLDLAIQDGRLSFPDVKPPAIMTIDDRARRFDGPGTFPSVGEIEAFQPWWKEPHVFRGQIRVIELMESANKGLRERVLGLSKLLSAQIAINRRLRWTTAVSVIISVAAVLFATLVLLGRLP
jgi:5'(3')-deoxyribonucleotidase